jgi:hypothetical protein
MDAFSNRRHMGEHGPPRTTALQRWVYQLPNTLKHGSAST